MYVSSIKRKYLISFFHVLAWFILIITDVLSNLLYKYYYKSNLAFVLDFFLNYTFYVAYFYFNVRVIVPMLYKKQFKRFVISETLLCVLFIVWTSFVDITFSRDDEFTILYIFYYFDYFIFYFTLSTGYKILYDRFDTEKKLKENLQQELSFLRSQINPHFILNVLNNIVSLAHSNSKEVEPALLKLSSWMQYMLYGTGDKKIDLQSEAEYLQSYIDLQAQRFKNRVEVKVAFNNISEHYEIEAMLLMPFVENAFKHGIGRFKDPEINIHIDLKDELLYFKVWNRHNGVEQKNFFSGIGLENVKKRLELLYRDKYDLNIYKDDKWFYVNLQINLN